MLKKVYAHFTSFYFIIHSKAMGNMQLAAINLLISIPLAPQEGSFSTLPAKHKYSLFIAHCTSKDLLISSMTFHRPWYWAHTPPGRPYS